MAKHILSAVVCICLITACGNGTNNDVVTNPDSTLDSQKQVAAAPDSAAQTPFKNIMDMMMQDMHKMTMTNDPDHDFALMMKRHHEAAIEMANLEITKGNNEKYKQLAQKIMKDARKDIDDLTTFLTSRKPVKNSEFSKKAMDVMMKSSGMDMAQSNDADQQFTMAMTMHHQQGIDMAKEYLKTGTQQQQTKKVAEHVIKTNTEDLQKLKGA